MGKSIDSKRNMKPIELFDNLRELFCINKSEIGDAFLFIAEKFKDKKRDSGEEVIFHPLRILQIIHEVNLNLSKEDLKIVFKVTLLHDILEDTDTTEEEMISNFGLKILNYIKILTLLRIPKEQLNMLSNEEEDKVLKERDKKYFEGIFKSNNILFKVIKICDRLDNINTFSGLLKRLPKKSLAKYISSTERDYLPEAKKLSNKLYKEFINSLNYAKNLLNSV